MTTLSLTLPSRPVWRRAGLLAAGLLLAGCAAMNTIHSEIATYGEWPAGRAPGSYAFDRLPSQQAQPEAAARLEAAAMPALEQAGFRPAGAGQTPDVLVQVAARTSRVDVDVWADPLWYRGGWGLARQPWVGPLWWGDVRYERSRYDREVALLLRDRASGKPLYEARASNEGYSGAGDALNTALFRAALFDFPRTGPNPRTVTVTLP